MEMEQIDTGEDPDDDMGFRILFSAFVAATLAYIVGMGIYHLTK